MNIREISHVSSLNYSKFGKCLTSFVLSFSLIFSPAALAEAPVTGDKNAQTPLQLSAEKPKVITNIEQIPLTELNEDSVNSLVVFLTPDLYERVKVYLDTKIWQPVRAGFRLIGYVAKKTPQMVWQLTESFKFLRDDSTGKGQDKVTRVTTAIGVTSTITSFGLGVVGNHGADLLYLSYMVSSLMVITYFYRKHYDFLGNFFSYKGWSKKEVLKNNLLQEVYEENIRNKKNIKPQGLIDEGSWSRLAKLGLVDLMFMLVVDSYPLFFSSTPKDLNKDFFMTYIGYTMTSVYEILITKELVKRKVKVRATEPAEVAFQQNRLSFFFKLASIGSAFLQNFASMYGLAGSEIAQWGLIGAGGSLIAYEFWSNRPSLSCPGAF